MSAKVIYAAGAAALALIASPALAQPMSAEPMPPGPHSPHGATSMPGEMVPAADAAMPTPSAPTTPASGAADASATEPSIPAGVPADATIISQMVTNGPVADTPENRARFGEPMSRAGKMTRPAGN